MNTLTINSKAALTLARASEKARQVKPLVRKTNEYGIYEVQASDKSRWYTVKCNSATKQITCNCKASKPCYHIAAVTPLHVYIARQKQEAEKAAALAAPVQPVEVERFCTCGEIATSKEGYCEFCQAEKDRSDIF